MPDGVLEGQTKLVADSFEPKQLTDNKDFRLRLFRFLLLKYADLINDFEKKTVGEIKALVDGNDLSVQSIVADFKPQDFVFEKDYLSCAEKAFEFVQKEIVFVRPELDLNFWLSPSEVMRERIGDDKDKAVFLCAILAGLGDEVAQVVVAEMTDGSSHAFVTTEHAGKFFILDSCIIQLFNEFSGDKAKVLSHYLFNGTKISRFLYRFNKNDYEQFM